MRRTILPALLMLVAAGAGCNMLAYPLYLIAPSPPRRTVKAECDRLPEKAVAVVISASMDTLYEYPYTRHELTACIARELQDNIRKVQVIDPTRVIRYQNANVHWNTHPVTEVGRALGADYVLYISLSEFSTHEPGSINLPVGRISAATSLWDVAADPVDPAACVWRKTNVAVKVDASTGLLAWDPSALRREMQWVFASKLTKYFYDHKVPRGSRGDEEETDLSGSAAFR